MLLKIIFTLVLAAFGFYLFASGVSNSRELSENKTLSKDARNHVVLCEAVACILILFLIASLWDKPDSSYCTLSEDDYGMMMGCIDELSFLCDKYSDAPDDEINSYLDLLSDTLESNYVEIEK